MQAGEFMLLTEEQAAAFPFLPLLKQPLLNGPGKQCVCLVQLSSTAGTQVQGKFGVRTTDLWLLAFDLCYPSSLVNIVSCNRKYCFLTKKQRF